MNKLLICCCTLLAVMMMTGCGLETRQFNLPRGDVEQGKANFVAMGCNDCHSVNGINTKIEQAAPGDIKVTLGGRTTQVKTYADLLTSIVHPSHKLSRGNNPATVNEEGESKMRNYNDEMTVQELIDLVEFLQAEYEIWVPDYYVYRHP